MKKLNEQGIAGNMAVGVIAALVIGMGGGYAIGHSSKTTTNSTNTNASTSAPGAASETSVEVGGAAMVSTKNIVQNALNANNVTTTVALVKDAGLVSTLESPGPFTVFAPNNAAFTKLPAATVKALQQPANVSELKQILTYHVVSGTYTSAALRVMAEKGQTMTTVEGEQLTPILQNGQLELKDAKGNLVTIQTPDVISSNGVTFVINSVLMP